VGCHTDGALEGGIEDLAEGRMSVSHHGQLADGRARSDSICALLDEIRCVNADDVHAQNLLSLLVVQILGLREDARQKRSVEEPKAVGDTAYKGTEAKSQSPILYGAADTLFGGSISREQVAEVAVASCFLPEAKNLIVEIVASREARPVTYREGFRSVR
jgi:hypothetical protein